MFLGHFKSLDEIASLDEELNGLVEKALFFEVDSRLQLNLLRPLKWQWERVWVHILLSRQFRSLREVLRFWVVGDCFRDYVLDFVLFC